MYTQLLSLTGDITAIRTIMQSTHFQTHQCLEDIVARQRLQQLCDSAIQPSLTPTLTLLASADLSLLDCVVLRMVGEPTEAALIVLQQMAALLLPRLLHDCVGVSKVLHADTPDAHRPAPVASVAPSAPRRQNSERTCRTRELSVVRRYYFSLPRFPRPAAASRRALEGTPLFSVRDLLLLVPPTRRGKAVFREPALSCRNTCVPGTEAPT